MDYTNCILNSCVISVVKDLGSEKYITVFSVNGDASRKMRKDLRKILGGYGIDEAAFNNEGYSFTAVIDNKNCISQHCAPEIVTEDVWAGGVHILAKSIGTAVEKEWPLSSIVIDGTKCQKIIRD